MACIYISCIFQISMTHTTDEMNDTIAVICKLFCQQRSSLIIIDMGITTVLLLSAGKSLKLDDFTSNHKRTKSLLNADYMRMN